MNKNILKILNIIFLLLLPYSFSLSQGFINNGAYIFTAGKTYINVNNFDFKNNSGKFLLKYNSNLTATNNISNGGTFNTYNSSVVNVGGNFINSLSVTLTDQSKLIVKKKVINSGGIFNGYIIELGE